jgi:hypothetical protein
MIRIKRLATLLIALIAIFCIYWSIHVLSWIIPFTFGDGMQNTPWVEDGVTITLWQRVSYFALVAPTILLAWVSFYYAFKMLIAIRSGALFELKTCRYVQFFGGFLTLTMLFDTLISTFQLAIITWENAPVVMQDGEKLPGSIGRIPVIYYFDSTSITLVLCGLGFCVAGWVLSEAVHIAHENEAFI